jgi:hypothetical protein
VTPPQKLLHILHSGPVFDTTQLCLGNTHPSECERWRYIRPRPALRDRERFPANASAAVRLILTVPGMSDTFAVDPAALSSVTQGITQAVAALGSSAGNATAVPAAATGHPGLAEALGTFGERWTQGVQHLVKDGQSFADGLAQTSTAYQQVEQRVAQALLAAGPS